MKFTPNELKMLIKASYSPDLEDVLDKYFIDAPLSDNRVKVFTLDGTDEVVVTHRGSADLKDWKDNWTYATRLIGSLKSTNTWKHHFRKHKAAVAKYGAANITAVGHSRGGAYCKQLYKDKLCAKAVTYNSPVNFGEVLADKASILMGRKKKKDPNFTRVRTENDGVSVMEKLMRNKTQVIVPNDSLNPLTAHGSDALDALPDDQLIGSGIFGGGRLQKLKVAKLKEIIKAYKRENRGHGLPNITGLKKSKLVELVASLE